MEKAGYRKNGIYGQREKNGDSVNMGMFEKILYTLNKKIQLTDYELTVDRNLPEDGLRIVQVSDVQSEYFGESQSFIKETVREIEPDLIVLTGDLLDRNRKDFTAAMDAAEGLTDFAPVFYVDGNHEMDISFDETRAFYAELAAAGICILFDKAHTVPVRGGRYFVSVMGLSEATVFHAHGQSGGTGRKERRRYQDASVITQTIHRLAGESGARGGSDADGASTAGDKRNLRILLSHEPQLIEYYAHPAIDLVFTGHAHGGQFRLPGGRGLVAPDQGIFPKYTQGVHRCGKTQMIVSRGLGNSRFPLRLNNRPEIVQVIVKAPC